MAAQGVDVVSDVGTSPTVVQSKVKVADDDLALARILQEQEMAFFNLASGEGLDYELGVEGGFEDDHAGSSEDYGDEELDDEELARRLQAEEDQAAYQQLMGLSHNAGLQQLAASIQEAADPDALDYEDLQALGDVAGTVSKALSTETAQQLPQLKYDELLETSKACLDKCCICQLEFERDDQVKMMPCQHYYHSDCIAQWFNSAKTCPYCNKEVTASN